MSGNWKTLTYNGTQQPESAVEVAEQYTPMEALAIIKTLSIIHDAFDEIVVKARKDATQGGGMVGLSVMYNLNLQKLINQIREKNPDTKLHELLFPETKTDKDGQKYHIGLVGLCKIDGKLELCQIISPFDVVRKDNVTAVKSNNRITNPQVASLNLTANHWLKNGDDWVEFELTNFDDYKDQELYVQVLTGRRRTTGETQYTVTGGEKRLLIDGDKGDARGFVHADQFLLVPKEIITRNFDEYDLNPTLFECDLIDMSSHQYSPLHDALERKIAGNYKQHGRLYEQESYAQAHIDVGGSKLAVATPAVGQKLYCILCKRPIPDKYDVDHIFNLIFNTFFDLNGEAGGFFDTCPKCNQAFKGEMLWCPNYDVWDALLKRLLEIYKNVEGRPQTIEDCRFFFPWPGIKCQGVIPASGQPNMRPFGGWRTFITGWHKEHEADEEAATATLLEHDIGATLNGGEFDKAQSLKYTRGSNTTPLSKDDDNYLSTFVIQDLFLRRVLFVTHKNKIWTKDRKEATDFIVENQAEHTLSTAAKWKQAKEDNLFLKLAAKAGISELPQSPSTNIKSNQAAEPIPLSQGTKNLFEKLGEGVKGRARRIIEKQYLFAKSKEVVAKAISELSGKSGNAKAETQSLKSVGRLIEIVKREGAELMAALRTKKMSAKEEEETMNTLDALKLFLSKLEEKREGEVMSAINQLRDSLSVPRRPPQSPPTAPSKKSAKYKDGWTGPYYSKRLQRVFYHNKDTEQSTWNEPERDESSSSDEDAHGYVKNPPSIPRIANMGDSFPEGSVGLKQQSSTSDQHSTATSNVHNPNQDLQLEIRISNALSLAVKSASQFDPIKGKIFDENQLKGIIMGQDKTLRLYQIDRLDELNTAFETVFNEMVNQDVLEMVGPSSSWNRYRVKKAPVYTFVGTQKGKKKKKRGGTKKIRRRKKRRKKRTKKKRRRRKKKRTKKKRRKKKKTRGKR